MATNIFNYNGTLRTTIADGAIDNTTSIAMPGRGYLNYGEPVNQDLLWIMQNFANTTAPINPVQGQLWYNTTTGLINVWTGAAWISSAVYAGSSGGVGSQPGALWFDTVNLQLNVWNGTAWNIVGPLGSQINTDPLNPSIPSYTAFQAARITDTISVNHEVWEIVVGGTLLAIYSKDAAFTPSPAISGFTTVNPGLNFSTTVAGSSVTSPNIFSNNKNNVPDSNALYNMGSVTYRFANMYAINFNGQATSALYADLAERYESDAELDVATVVSIGGSAEITAANTPGDTNVFGVVSTNPAYLMNSSAGDDVTHPAVALTGRVPCKIVGPVKKGQRLMTSTVAGCACVWTEEYGLLSILGRALQDKKTDGIEIIEIVIGKN